MDIDVNSLPVKQVLTQLLPRNQLLVSRYSLLVRLHHLHLHPWSVVLLRRLLHHHQVSVAWVNCSMVRWARDSNPAEAMVTTLTKMRLREALLPCWRPRRRSWEQMNHHSPRQEVRHRLPQPEARLPRLPHLQEEQAAHLHHLLHQAKEAHRHLREE